MQRFDDDAVRRILERARRIEGDPVAGSGLDAAALVEAATEVGFDTDVIRESIALESLGAREPTHPLDRWSGAAAVQVDGVVERSPDDALASAIDWLERSHRMVCRRVDATTVVGRRRSDVSASIGRSFADLRGGGRVGRLDRVRVEIVAWPAVPPPTSTPELELPDASPGGPVGAPAVRGDEPRSTVRITGERSVHRRSRLTAGGLLIGTGGATVAIGIAESFVAWPLAAVLFGGAGAAAVTSGARHADRVESDLEGLLAAIGEGRTPAGALRRAARAARRSVEG